MRNFMTSGKFYKPSEESINQEKDSEDESIMKVIDSCSPYHNNNNSNNNNIMTLLKSRSALLQLFSLPLPRLRVSAKTEY